MDDDGRLSFEYDPQQVLPLSGRVAGMCHCLNRLPVLPELLEDLARELVEQSIHASAAISGNPMRLDEVREELARDPVEPSPAGPTVARARREIANLGLAYAPLPKLRTESGVFNVSEAFVRKVHAVTVQGTVPDGVGQYVPDQDGESPGMAARKLVERINGAGFAEETQAVRAGLLHYHLFRLRPFAEGSGRVARFFEASILAVAGFRLACLSLPQYYRKNIDAYLGWFRPGEPDSLQARTGFLCFQLTGLLQGLEQLHERLTAPLQALALAEQYRQLFASRQLNRRSHELLLLLLQRDPAEPAGFQLKDLFLRQPYKLLYDKVSEHTARRDLNRLLELGLLSKEGLRYALVKRLPC
ncbi:MAG: Fic family protein [Desulfovibrionaceae bacterium]